MAAACFATLALPREGLAGQGEMVAEVGKYSAQYSGDWSNLPDGKRFPRQGATPLPLEEVYGNTVRKSFHGQKIVELKDIALRVKWSEPYHKYSNTLFHIRDCEKVVIENLSILQADHDYRAAHTILIENCDTVVIRNSFLAGTVQQYHIRIEGCRKVFLDNIEVSGHDYGSKGVRSGGGIWVDNGAESEDHPDGMRSANARELEFCVIQNCYIHDNLAVDKRRNQDGILIHSASNGVVFNCFFENWKSGDAALDVSHRRSRGSYRGRIFRVERNVFKNNSRIKTVGTGSSGNKVLYANNLYLNSLFIDYHQFWDAHHVNETFIFDGGYEQDAFFKLWGLKGGATYFRNCLLHSTSENLNTMFLQGTTTWPDQYQFILPDFFVYLMEAPSFWVRGQKQTIKALSEWRAGGRDINSVLARPSPCFADRERGDFRPRSTCAASGAGSDEYVKHEEAGMRVAKDFYGRPRGGQPSAGAFEYIP